MGGKAYAESRRRTTDVCTGGPCNGLFRFYPVSGGAAFGDFKRYMKLALKATPSAAKCLRIFHDRPEKEPDMEFYKELVRINGLAVHFVADFLQWRYHVDGSREGMRWLESVRKRAKEWQLQHKREIHHWIRLDGELISSVFDDDMKRESMMDAIQTWPHAVQYCTKETSDDFPFFKAAIERDHATVQYLPGSVLYNATFHEFILSLFAINGMILQHWRIQEFLSRIDNDEKLQCVQNAVKNNGLALQHAGCMRWNKRVYEAAIAQNENAKEFGPCQGYNREPHAPTDEKLWDEQIERNFFPVNTFYEPRSNLYYCLDCYRSWMVSAKNRQLCASCHIDKPLEKVEKLWLDYDDYEVEDENDANATVDWEESHLIRYGEKNKQNNEDKVCRRLPVCFL